MGFALLPVMQSFLIPVRAFALIAASAFAWAYSIAAFAGEPDLDVKVQVAGEEVRAFVSLFVRAPPQRVWDVITDYERAPQYTRDLQVSRVVSRSGGVLRVFQRNVVRLGPFTMPIETLREVRLVAPARAESRLVGGSMRKYDSTTELVPEDGGTRVLYRSQAIPGSPLARLVDETTIREHTEERFRELRAEILRRETVAAIRP